MAQMVDLPLNYLGAVDWGGSVGCCNLVLLAVVVVGDDEVVVGHGVGDDDLINVAGLYRLDRARTQQSVGAHHLHLSRPPLFEEARCRTEALHVVDYVLLPPPQHNKQHSFTLTH